MRTSTSRRPGPRALAGLLALLVLAGCGPKHHLGQYSFTGQTIAVVVMAPPSPGLLEAEYRARASDDIVATVVRAGATTVKNAEGGRARARLDSAATRVSPADALSERTLERASRYLGVQPVKAPTGADFLLEVHMRNFGIDVRGRSAASLYMNADVVLLDKRTGREIWNTRVRATDRLTPRVRADDPLPGTIVTAGTLHAVTVADFEEALDQLVQLSSNVITNALRASLRDARRG